MGPASRSGCPKAHSPREEPPRAPGPKRLQSCLVGCQHPQRGCGRMKCRLSPTTMPHSCPAPTCFCRPPPPPAGTSLRRSPTCPFLSAQTVRPRRPGGHGRTFCPTWQPGASCSQGASAIWLLQLRLGFYIFIRFSLTF